MDNHSKIIKKPEWLKVRYNEAEVRGVYALTDGLGLNTVCRGANCPNIGQCSRRHTATFMILGNICTRNCRFCNISHTNGALTEPDPDEPRKIGYAAKKLGLKHVVVTCVTRDDLPDGGAAQFAATIREIRAQNPTATVEVLISDMQGSHDALDVVMAEKPEVLNHNVETVRELYAAVRPEAEYERSLDVLRYCASFGTSHIKTGFMLGLGETDEQIYRLMDDVRAAGCDFLTIGQYLQPTKFHAPLVRYVTPAEFDAYKAAALSRGFAHVASAPLARSSYLAAEALDSATEALDSATEALDSATGALDSATGALDSATGALDSATGDRT